MNADDDRGFNLLSARWLALGAAAGVALSLALAQSGIQGPWQGIALVLALWVTVLLTAMAGSFAYSMRTEALAAGNAIGAAKARAALERPDPGGPVMSQECVIDESSLPPTRDAAAAASTTAMASAWPVSSSQIATRSA